MSENTNLYDTLFRAAFAEPRAAKALSLFLLPDVLPVVIYHGKEKWGAPQQFAELIEGGRQALHVPHYEPVFINITTLADREITGSLRLVLGLVALKYTRLEMDEAAEELLTDLFHRGMADPRTRYLVRVAQQVYTLVKPEKVVDRLVAVATHKGYHEIEGGYMTWAEAKRKEGLEEGLEEGSLQRSRDVLIRQTDRKFGLTVSERERISACSDQGALDAALDEILDAQSKAQVLEKLP